MKTQGSLWDIKLDKKSVKIDDNVKHNVIVGGKKEILYHHKTTDSREKIQASYYKNMPDSDLIPAIVNLVWESPRKMPAHFTSNGERKQSFCVNFQDIDPDDEYQMASESYIGVGECMRSEDKITPEQYMTIVRCGEDIMIGSYITEKLKKSKNLEEIVSRLTQMNRDSWPEEQAIPKVFETQSARDWFNYCKTYGVRVAQGNRMPFSAKATDKSKEKIDTLSNTGFTSPIEIIEIIKGDITKLAVDAIVNSAHPTLLAGSGVCGAIHKVAGKELEKECKTIAGDHYSGQVAVTKGHDLQAKYVLHVIVPKAKEQGKLSPSEKKTLANCYEEAINTANRCGIKTLAFPSLGTGVRDYPLEDVANLAIKTIIEYLDDYHPDAFEKIYIVTHSEKDYIAYQNAYKKYLS